MQCEGRLFCVKMNNRNHFKSLKKHDVQSNPTRAHNKEETHKRDGATIRR